MLVKDLKVEKLVHGGQGLCHDDGGRSVFIWGVLPGEVVDAQLTKSKKDWAEGVISRMVKAAPQRIDVVEPEVYLGSSPWQMMSYEFEKQQKELILKDTFRHAGLDLHWTDFYHPEERFGYRNKMEYSFWWDNGRLDLALHARGSRQKIAVEQSVLASAAINQTGRQLVDFLNSHQVGGRQLKSVILRSSGGSGTGIVLYTRDEHLVLPWDEINTEVFRVYYSNPKSPASVPTKLLYSTKQSKLKDQLLNREFTYSPEGFFQVNLDPYMQALEDVRTHTAGEHIVDLYAGVGSIGMSLDFKSLKSIELEGASSEQAKLNSGGQSNIEVIQAKSEDSLDYIKPDQTLIVDPPRAGLHKDVLKKIGEAAPPKLIYLSCNPATQVRDIAYLTDYGYAADFARGYNFFPSTPHIESLVVLVKS